MPILTTNFNPIFPLKSGHLNTVYRSLFMKDNHNYTRKRITTWDNDFIDLDFSTVFSNSVILLIHGLEGSSKSNYMITAYKEFNKHGFDTICMNLRGCSGEDNVSVKSYHSGKTDDVNFIINHISNNYNYDNIIICGYSLGGNLTLKYLGEYDIIPKTVKGGIAISVPIDLTSSQAELHKLKNKVYLNDFIRTLKQKIYLKAKKHPELNIDLELLSKATQFRHIEKLYTVPVFNFNSPEDYWERASSKPYIPKIKHNTLLINAKNDTFLPEDCYPYDDAKDSDLFHLMVPNYGGHVGFISSFMGENRWIEYQIINFITQQMNVIPTQQNQKYLANS